MLPVSNGDINNIANKQSILARYYTFIDQVVVKLLSSIGRSLIVVFARYPKPLFNRALFRTVTAKSIGFDLIKYLTTAHLIVIHFNLPAQLNDCTFLFQ